MDIRCRGERSSNLLSAAGWGRRLRQFFRRVLARRPPDALVLQVLHPAACELFRRMSAVDQRHAEGALRALRVEGDWRAEVEQAALLHDVGKSQARLTLAHRIAMVLLETLAPRALERLGAPAASPWRHPFYVHVHHAEIGAALCAQAGCSPATVALVRAHQGQDVPELTPELQAALAALRRADERS